MKRMIRRMICWFVGCNYICLHRHTRIFDQFHYSVGSSTTSGWQYVRCDDTRNEQWDV